MSFDFLDLAEIKFLIHCKIFSNKQMQAYIKNDLIKSIEAYDDYTQINYF